MNAEPLGEEEIFDQARRLDDVAARAAYLDQACGDDAPLRKRINALLRIHDKDRDFLEPSARRPDPSWTVAPGTVIGPYTLSESIGEGGMGVVFRAEQTEPIRREVALKIIKPGMNTAQVVARLERERHALALMDHPNIARILDAGESPSVATGGLSRPYFVMELIHGTPITNYCDEHHLTPRQRLELFIPVCQAVQHAHQKGIIHRDIKPSNVLVTQVDGRPVPKIIDFGVAKALEGQLTNWSKDTNVGAIIGTLEYMSPEQAVPSEADVDTRSDIYSLGVLLYELLTGTTPLQRKKLKEGALLEALRIIREVEPQKPSTRISTVDELPSIAANRGLDPRQLSGVVRGDLDWIVMKSLEKDRSRRYETANGFARDLQRFLSDEPVEARPPSAIYRLGKLARRNKAAVIASTACISILVGATGVSLWQAWRATNAEAQSRINEATAVAALKRADNEAAISKAVNQFLQDDLLGQADVGNQPRGMPRNKDLTVRAVLDRAAKGISGKFQDQELTEAAIRLTMGQAYLALAEYQLATEQLQKSLALRQRLLGDQDPDTWDSMWSLGGLYRLRGQYNDAEPLLKQVCESYKAKLGEKNPKTLRAMHSLGLLYNESNKFNFGDDILRQVLQLRREILGPEHVETLNAMYNVADGHRRRREPDKAEALVREALDGYRKLLGPDNSRTLAAMADLAKDCSDQGRHDEAEKLLRESYQGHCALLTADHPMTLNVLYTLGVLNERLNRLDEAERDYRGALEGLRRRMGPGHSLPMKVAKQLAKFYIENERFNNAETLLKEILETYLASPNAGPDDVDKTRAMLGVAYLQSQRFEEAEALLRQVVKNCESRMPLSDEPRLNAHVNWGVAKLKLGQFSEAESLLRPIVDYGREYHKTTSRVFNINLTWLALALLKEEKFAEAESLARESLDNRNQAVTEEPEPIRDQRPKGWEVFDSQALLGRVLAAQKKYAEAEPWLTKGITGLLEQKHKLEFIGRDRLAEALACLIQMYGDWGKPEEAAKWRKEQSSNNP